MRKKESVSEIETEGKREEENEKEIGKEREPEGVSSLDGFPRQNLYRMIECWTMECAQHNKSVDRISMRDIESIIHSDSDSELSSKYRLETNVPIPFRKGPPHATRIANVW